MCSIGFANSAFIDEKGATFQKGIFTTCKNREGEKCPPWSIQAEKINHNSIEDGSTTVNASTLYDIVRKLPDNKEIEFIANDGKILSIRSGSSRFSLACLPRADFPIIETEDAGIKLKVDSQTFFKLIEKTKFAISNEETPYFLNGLYFNLRKDEKNNL